MNDLSECGRFLCKLFVVQAIKHGSLRLLGSLSGKPSLASGPEFVYIPPPIYNYRSLMRWCLHDYTIRHHVLCWGEKVIPENVPVSGLGNMRSPRIERNCSPVLPSSELTPYPVRPKG